MSDAASIESLIGRVAQALPGRPRAWVKANGARAGRVAACWARAAARRVAYGWLTWEAISLALSRRNGVVAAARRRLWDTLRANPAIRPYLGAPWVPGWFGCAQRFPCHSLLLAAFVALAVALATTHFSTDSLICSTGSSGHCRQVLRDVVGVVLAAQVTLLAVVFPIAVTLVTVLGGGGLQRGERLWLFFADTELKAAGVSALLLTATCTAALTLGDGLSPQGASAWLSLCAVWFVLNLSGAAFFLWRGVSFVLPDGQDGALRRQLARRIWPEEAAPKLADAVVFNTLRGDGEVRQQLYMLWQSADVDTAKLVTVAHTGPRLLTEIRLGVLVAVERALTQRCDAASPPLIAFAAPLDQRIGGISEGTTTLAKAICALLPLERWLIRRAYRFTMRSPNEGMPTGEDLIRGLVDDALTSSRAGSLPAFEDRLRNLAALYGFLLRLSSRPEGGRRLSYTTELTGDSDFVLGRSWAGRLAPLVEQAAARLPDAESAFARVVRLPVRIGDEAGTSVPPAALVATDWMLAYLAYRLCDRGAEIVTGEIGRAHV